MAELGGSQISALLESVPGIAKVLRSPVADALVAMIRAGAGIGDFRLSDVEELVQFSVRRGLISADEGEQLTAEVRRTGRGRRGGRSRSKTPTRARTAPKRPFHQASQTAAKKGTAKKGTAKKVPSKKPAKKPTKKKRITKLAKKAPKKRR